MSKITLKIIVEDTRLSYKETFESDATVGALLASVLAKSGIGVALLFSGFPPIEIVFGSREDRLSDVGISTGCVVSVRRRPIVVRRVVDADNSCMFHSLSYAITRDRNRGVTLYREAVAEAIARNTDKYCEAVLGRAPSDYMDWIKQSTSWGGEIEQLLSLTNRYIADLVGILSSFLRTEIAAVDVQTNNIYMYTPEEETATERIYLIYDGIHYDLLVYAKSDDAPETGDVTTFRPSDMAAFAAIKEKAQQLRDQRQFVDLSGFEITCMVCNLGFRGEKEAAEHAKLTLHQNFSQK